MDNVTERIDKMLIEIARLNEQNKILKYKLENTHNQYDEIVNWTKRMYCLPSQSDEIMGWIVEGLQKIEESK